MAETEQELRDYFKEFGEISNLRLMLARKQHQGGRTGEDASIEEAAVVGGHVATGAEMLGFGFVCFKSVEEA